MGALERKTIWPNSATHNLYLWRHVAAAAGSEAAAVLAASFKNAKYGQYEVAKRKRKRACFCTIGCEWRKDEKFYIDLSLSMKVQQNN